MTDVDSADYSLRILWSLARWVEDTKGRAALEELAAKARVRVEDFDGSTRWVSHDQVEIILKEALAIAGDEKTFLAAFEHRFAEAFGPFRFMIWGVSQQTRNELAVKMSEKVATKVGTFEVLKSAPNEFAFRYRSQRPESRLLCLSRQVPWRIGPTLWGFPPSHLVEKACIAHGDEYCEYDIRSFAGTSVVPMIAGGIAGVVGAVLVAMSGSPHVATLSLPLLGAALAYVYELRRISQGNVNFAQSVNTAFRELGEAEADSRTEIAAMQQRQREWIHLMETQVTERTRTLEQIVSGLDGLQQSRVSTIRGFSHDLRNPLFVVRGNAQFLRDKFTEGEEGDALKDMEAAASQIETMLSRLMEVATADTGFVKLAPRPVLVSPLAEVFRRRLRALVHGRDIKVSVFCTREAPEELTVDPLVFDRVVDNLLTNAAKYTPRGSILLEISGTPTLPGAPDTSRGYLTLKLSDTGRGIPGNQVERIFRPRSADEPSSSNSYGIGLSSVVRLMGQIGGRLDVMSKPDVGTTFWAHFPVRPPEQQKRGSADDNIETLITRVVTVRKAEGA